MNWKVELRRFRRLHGYTQKALAEMIGADATSVSRWERGRDAPNAEFRERLTSLLQPGFHEPPANELGPCTDWPDLIKSLRRKRGMSQTDLSEILGVDPTTVSRWERGRDKPSLAIQRQLRSLASELQLGRQR